MSKNPILNAIFAFGYIVLVVSVIHLLGSTLGNKPDSPFAPAVFLSLLTLSASVMAYIFFYHPLQLLIDGEKKKALALFMQTVGAFAALTLGGLVLLLVGLL